MSYTFGIGGVWSGTFTGNGGGTTFNIPHNLNPQPDYAVVSFGSAAAAYNTGTSTTHSIYWIIDSTNIVVTYNAATTSGTNNITLLWVAGRKSSIRDEIHAITRDSIGDDDIP